MIFSITYSRSRIFGRVWAIRHPIGATSMHQISPTIKSHRLSNLTDNQISPTTFPIKFKANALSALHHQGNVIMHQQIHDKDHVISNICG